MTGSARGTVVAAVGLVCLALTAGDAAALPEGGPGAMANGASGAVMLAQADRPLPRARPDSEEDAAEGAAETVELHQGGNLEEPLHSAPTRESGEAAADSVFSGGGLRGFDLSPDIIQPMLEAERAIQQQLEIGPRPSFPLTVSARLTAEGELLPDGVEWRVFRSEPRSDGTFELVEESDEARPSFLLPADDYIVHVAYGRANTARRVSLKSGPAEQEIAVEAGGLRITGVDADEEEIPPRQLSLAVYSSEQDEYGRRRLIVEQATPGRIVRLNPGTYHVVSRFGDGNAEVRADLRVEAGQLTDARISHRAAAVTLKLVNEPGGEAMADTSWRITTPDGEVVTESAGAFPTHVLAAGDYAVIARHDGRLYNRDFSVQPGQDAEVELVAR